MLFVTYSGLTRFLQALRERVFCCIYHFLHRVGEEQTLVLTSFCTLR